MPVPINVMNSLRSLTCFSDIQAISLLANGLSQTSLKVTTASKVFFAKKLNDETANTEVTCALLCAQFNTEDALELDTMKSLSPQVIYHDQKWLVTDFVNGRALADSELKSDLKISTALTLMAKLHQLPTTFANKKIKQLNTKVSVKRLLTNPTSLLAKHSHFLNNVTQSLTTTINRLIITSQSLSVLCHGDINFTNILLDNAHRSWLIDFECAHFAPVEFDLAMFIAVNNIAKNNIDDIVNNYGKLVSSYRSNRELLNYYILYSYYINGLWYFNNTNELAGDELMHTLAIKQWSAFDSFSSRLSIEVPKLMSIIDVDSMDTH